jgi:hypothetical protein
MTKSGPKPKRKPQPADKYSRSYIPRVAKYAALGLTLNEIAGLLGVVPETLKTWLERETELAKALDAGEKQFDIDSVETAFIKKALPHDEVKITKYSKMRGRGDKRKPVVNALKEEIQKDVVDTTAAARILAAHKRDIYGEKTEIRVPDVVHINIEKKYDSGPKRNPS